MHVQCCRIFNGFGNKPKANSTKGEMKNGYIQYLIIEQNGVFVASVEHSDDCEEFFLLNLRIPDFCRFLTVGNL